MTTFILDTPKAERRARALFNTEEPAEDRLADLVAFLDQAGIPQLEWLNDWVIDGPDNPKFAVAIAEYGITVGDPCHPGIINRVMSMLVAGEIIPASQIDDQCLRSLIAVGFVSDLDWQQRSYTASLITRTYMHNHIEDYDMNQTDIEPHHLVMYGSLTGGLLVAASEARAETMP